MFKRFLTLALVFGFVPQSFAAIDKAKSQQLSKSLSGLVALTEALHPAMAKTKWQDPHIPGEAADRAASYKEMGCLYDLPIGENGSPTMGTPEGKIEISGENCPIYLLLELKGGLIEKQFNVDFSLTYEVRRPELLPNEDFSNVSFTGHLEGLLDVKEGSSQAKIDITGTMKMAGLSKSIGDIDMNSTLALKMDLSGFSFSMSQLEEHDMKIGAQSGQFKSETKMQFISAEEHFYIDGEEVAKDRYQSEFGEYKFPYFNSGMGAGSNHTASCRAEVFDLTQVGLDLLEVYAKGGAAPRVTPIKSLDSCQTDMIRKTDWPGAEMESNFRFGIQYLMMKSQIKLGDRTFQSRPLYVVYGERYGRSEKVSDQLGLVSICETVPKCGGVR
ncbi:MAG: hypothetical protein AB7F86_18145 [Bdellovibrionales bacterium]